MKTSFQTTKRSVRSLNSEFSMRRLHGTTMASAPLRSGEKRACRLLCPPRLHRRDRIVSVCPFAPVVIFWYGSWFVLL